MFRPGTTNKSYFTRIRKSTFWGMILKDYAKRIVYLVDDDWNIMTLVKVSLHTILESKGIYVVL